MEPVTTNTWTTTCPPADEVYTLPNESVPDDPAPHDQGETSVHRLTKALRRIGALVLIASAVTFVLQGWNGWDSSLRYYIFLGFSTVVAAAGVFCGLRFKDDKGARTLLGVAAAILPAHFCQLGAFLFSLTRPDTSKMHSIFVYTAPSPAMAILTTLFAVAVLTPIAYLGFSAFARVENRRITALYLLLNALLLIPTRTPNAIAAIAAAGLLLNVLADLFVFGREKTMRNFEGAIVRIMLCVPVVVLCARSFLLYSANDLLSSVLLTGLGLTLISAGRVSKRDDSLIGLAELLSMPILAYAWKYFAYGMFLNSYAPFNHLFSGETGQYFVPVIMLPACAVVFAASMLAKLTDRGMRTSAAIAATVFSVAQLAAYGGIAIALTMLLMGIGAIVAAFVLQERPVLYCGVVQIAIGLLYHIRYAISLYSMSPWLTLAALGLTVVIGSSYLEAHYRTILARAGAFRKRLDGWS